MTIPAQRMRGARHFRAGASSIQTYLQPQPMISLTVFGGDWTREQTYAVLHVLGAAVLVSELYRPMQWSIELGLPRDENEISQSGRLIVYAPSISALHPARDLLESLATQLRTEGIWIP